MTAPGAGRSETDEARFLAAEAAWAAGDVAGAVAGYRALLLERLAAADRDRALFRSLDQGDAVTIERLADGALLLGDGAAADDLLAGLAGVLLDAGNKTGALYAGLKRLLCALDRGALREAQAVLDDLAWAVGDPGAIEFTGDGLAALEAEIARAIAPPAAERPALFAELHLGLGRLLAALGQYGEALAALARGLGHAERGAADLARRLRPHLRLARAQALCEKGTLDDAAAEVERLLGEVDERRQPGLHSGALEVRGKVELLRGELGAALGTFERVRASCRARRLPRAAAAASVNLAHVKILLNQTAGARELLEESVALAEEVGAPELAARARTLEALAQARARSLAGTVAIAASISELWHGSEGRGEPGAAPEADPRDLPQASSFLAFFEDRALGVLALLGRGTPAEAKEALDELREVFGPCDSELVGLRLRLAEATVAYYAGDHAGAAKELEGLREPLRNLGLRPDLWQAQRVLGWCWARLGRPAEAQRALAEETNALLTAMAGTLPPAERAIYRLNKWTAEEEFLAGEIDALTRLRARIEASRLPRPGLRLELLRRLARLLDQVDAYKVGVARRALEGATDPAEAPAGAGRETPAPRPLWRRLLGHPRDRASISFLVLPDRVLVARLGFLSLDFGVSPLTRIQVRELVARWHRALASGGGRPGSPALAVAEELARGLQLPPLVAALPRRIRALTIVPDDALHGFPFAAVRHEGRFLVERFALSVGFERSGPPRRPPLRGGSGLAAAVSRGAGELPPLPETLRELAAVSRFFERRRAPAVSLADDAATRAALLEALPRARMAHLACHGVFRPDRPGESGLVLAPADDRTELLSLRDLGALDLGGLDHATLSACWSADNFVLPGRVVVSLPETLCRAGARSVLGSLWPVEDHVAVAVMTRFYDGLDRGPRDEALRAAQLACLSGALDPGARLDVTDPVYWAGYTLYGDTRELRP